MPLTEQARKMLAAAGLTEEQWARANWMRSGNWSGDDCGCGDDLCIGHHHSNEGDCGCLPSTIEQWLDGDPFRWFAVKPPGPVVRIRRIGAYNLQAGRPGHRYRDESTLTGPQRRRVRKKFNRTWF